MTAPFRPPGTPEYAEATASFQLAATVDPAGAATARSVDEVERVRQRVDPAGLFAGDVEVTRDRG